MSQAASTVRIAIAQVDIDKAQAGGVGTAKLMVYANASVPGISATTGLGTNLVNWVNVAFTNNGDGTYSFSAANVNGLADGTPKFARLCDSSGNAVRQFTAGVGSGEVNFTANVSLNGQCVLTSAVVTTGDA